MNNFQCLQKQDCRPMRKKGSMLILAISDSEPREQENTQKRKETQCEKDYQKNVFYDPGPGSVAYGNTRYSGSGGRDRLCCLNQ